MKNELQKANEFIQEMLEDDMRVNFSSYDSLLMAAMGKFDTSKISLVNYLNDRAAINRLFRVCDEAPAKQSSAPSSFSVSQKEQLSWLHSRKEEKLRTLP